MKQILGLDLGVGSIGWCLIEASNDNDPQHIKAMGSRIVPLTSDDIRQFPKGKSISKNQERTIKRTARKCYDRYQQRRTNLTAAFRHLGMLPNEQLIKLPAIELWQLRADAATPGTKLTLPEIGRVLYHINQRRGYKHAKSDVSGDAKQREYVANINRRFALIKERNQTIGQYFTEQLKKSEIKTENGSFYSYRIKEQVFPREAYEAEFDQIIDVQRKFYPEILTDQTINHLRNEIIFYQRGLKSCKHLVALCEFEKKEYSTKDGKTVYDGPKVTPRTSPLFQVCKIWESINNIKLTNRNGDTYPLTLEQKHNIFKFLDNNEKLTLKDLYKLLGISSKEGWYGSKAIGQGLQGNITKIRLQKALTNFSGNIDQLLKFDIVSSEYTDKATGEITHIINRDVINEPIYRLWHTIYSIQDKDELMSALSKNFGITDNNVISELYKLDFIKPGFGNKSAKAIRKILPFLQEGEMYSDACNKAGYNHSNSLTNTENLSRDLVDFLPILPKNTLRQPIVEKILNQMINIVNAITTRYGKIDTIRIELARELKQSKAERESMYENMRKRERENNNYKGLISQYGVNPSRSRIQKYRLWEESQKQCFYCGKMVNITEYLNGFDVEVEHIIPRSLFFDDSYANKVCACRECNAAKGNKTAYDFMKSKSEQEFQDYLTRINESYKGGHLSRTKRERLLTPATDIPQDFIDRDLRLSQYISRKAVEILKQICYNVYTTTGSVTDFIRKVWGYDMILHNLNLERYRNSDLIEIIEYDHHGQIHSEERIKNWNKRIDHRHHAIDALIIAMTRQNIIQRLNRLNTERDQMFQEVSKQRDEWRADYSLLEQWLREQAHFSTAEVENAVSKIAVSFKSGKKVATSGKRIKYKNGNKIVLQNNIIVPRGALSQESVYGKILVLDKERPIKYAFENPHLIFKDYIRKLVESRLDEYNSDTKKAIASLTKRPIMIGDNHDIKLSYATCYKEEYVIRYDISSLEKESDINAIVDDGIRERVKSRIRQFSGNIKEALKDLGHNPIYADDNNSIPVKRVRCFTGLKHSAVTALRYNNNGDAISYVKPANNHHVAIYRDREGELKEHVVTFWTAVERVKYKIPVVVKSPNELWGSLIDRDMPEEFMKTLPEPNWTYIESLQLNEMFILGMSDDEFNDAIATNDKAVLCNHLYRVHKISSKEYCFRLHIETSVDDKYNGTKNQMLSKKMGKLIVIQSLKRFMEMKPKRVSVNLLGEIDLSNCNLQS